MEVKWEHHERENEDEEEEKKYKKEGEGGATGMRKRRRRRRRREEIQQVLQGTALRGKASRGGGDTHLACLDTPSHLAVPAGGSGLARLLR